MHVLGCEGGSAPHAVKVPRGMAIRRHKNASNVRFLDWLLLTKV